jgi:molybdopterin converting factor small subunit
MIKVRVHSSLNCYLPGEIRGKYIEVSLSDAPDLEKLLKTLRIPEGAVWITAVNDKTIPGTELKNFSLADGDEVQFFPAVSGG